MDLESKLDSDDIWCYSGEIPPERFDDKIAHPVQVIILAGIGPHGFRPEVHVNSQRYINLLIVLCIDYQ